MNTTFKLVCLFKPMKTISYITLICISISSNYFGQNNLLESIVDKERIVVEDNVFMPLFYNNNNLPLWIGFNSFRKISPLADGSIIKSTIPSWIYSSNIFFLST